MKRRKRIVINKDEVYREKRGKAMNLVIVKHENCGQKYLFKVPGKESVYAGDLVMVNNKRGKTLATCLCDSFSMKEGSDEYRAILTAFGATEPLTSVVGRYFYSQFKATEDVGGAAENVLQPAT